MYGIFRATLSAVFLLTLVTIWTAAAGAGREQRLMPQAFTLEPGQYRYNQFSLSRAGGRVYGRFRAQGGRGNDVEVYIFDADGFENWKNGHSAPTYYNSGRVTVGSINVELRGGEYYIVFSNTFSAVSNKAITAEVFLD